MKRVYAAAFCVFVLLCSGGCKPPMNLTDAISIENGFHRNECKNNSRAITDLHDYEGTGLVLSVPAGIFINKITVFAFYNREPTGVGGNDIYYKLYSNAVPDNDAILQEVLHDRKVFPVTGVCIESTVTLAVVVKNNRNDALSAAIATYTKKDVNRKPFVPGSGVMLQGFSWMAENILKEKNDVESWYAYLMKNADKIKEQFCAVWLPPPSLANSSYAPQGYAPLELNNLNSNYGSANDLEAFIKEINPCPVFADIVINHRDGYRWGLFANPQWTPDFESICGNDSLFTKEGAKDKGVTDKVATDKMPQGREKGSQGGVQGVYYNSFRNLDHTNTAVQAGITSWMNSVLYRVGFSGWRFDYVKGYDAKYAGQYNADSSSVFGIGEYWPSNLSAQTNASNQICTWQQEAATASGASPMYVFDFVLKDILNRFRENHENHRLCDKANFADFASENVLFRKTRGQAVTFVDNHDTTNSSSDKFQSWDCESSFIGAAYTFILMSPGFPCVFWNHYFESSCASVPKTGGKSYRTHIDTLINMRKTFEITSASPEHVLYVSKDVYIAKINGDHTCIILKIGNGTIAPSKIPECQSVASVMESRLPNYAGMYFAVWAMDDSSPAEIKEGLRNIVCKKNESDTGTEDKFVYAWESCGDPCDYMSWPGLRMVYNTKTESWTASIPNKCNKVMFSNGAGNESIEYTVSGENGIPVVYEKIDYAK